MDINDVQFVVDNFAPLGSVPSGDAARNSSVIGLGDSRIPPSANTLHLDIGPHSTTTEYSNSSTIYATPRSSTGEEAANRTPVSGGSFHDSDDLHAWNPDHFDRRSRQVVDSDIDREKFGLSHEPFATTS